MHSFITFENMTQHYADGHDKLFPHVLFALLSKAIFLLEYELERF